MMKKMMMKNNKGQMTILMIIMLLALFFAAIILLVVVYASTTIYDSLNINVSIGQVNLAETNEDTMGKFNEMVVSNADWWGLCLIIGMIMGLFLSAYFLRNSFPKWAIILDIFIIITIFIISLYISSTYQELLDSLAGADITILEDDVTKTSMFILNLPIFVVIIGVVMMVLFHSSIPMRKEERVVEGGFLQGV